MLAEISKTVVNIDPTNADWHPGCQSRPASPTGEVAAPPSGAPALRHIRDAASREPDTNVGWWVAHHLRAGRQYAFSCEAYLPADFAGNDVKLCLGQPVEREVDADLSARDRWQTLSIALTLPQDLAELSVILRVASDAETILYSTAWTLEYVTVAPMTEAIPPSPMVAAAVEIAAEPEPVAPRAVSPGPALIPPQPLPIAEPLDGEKFAAVARAMAEGREPPDLGLLVSAYIHGAGSYFDDQQHQARALIDAVAGRLPAFAAAEGLFDAGRAVRRDIVAALCPELLPSLYHPRGNEGLDEIALLEMCPNELMDDRLLPGISVLRHLARRPAVTAYATADACVYVHPYRYQVLSKDRSAMWLSGSPRALSRDAIGATELIEVDKDIVVLQDRFNFSDISHFLLDGVGRALLLAQALGDLRSSLLVFGGVPSEFHTAVCGVLCQTLNLSADNILFPDRGLTVETTRRCIWFSDQVETYLHPAQMAHPTSIALLRGVAQALPGALPGAQRVYLQPPSGTIANEAALSMALQTRGFLSVPPEGRSVAQLVGLFRNAEIVVAPHGPELTHLIAADALRDVIELFPPGGGADIYSLIAAAGGIRHTAVIGAGTSTEYDIDVDAVVRRIDRTGHSRKGPDWRKSANLLPGSQSMQEFRADPRDVTDIVAAPSIPGLVAGNTVMLHRGPPGDSGSLGVGRWAGLRLIRGLRYTASCWVYLPAQFDGAEILLQMTGSAMSRFEPADLTRRELWQRLIVTATPLSEECDLVLRLGMSAVAPPWFASTCWQLERGDTATAYVATP